MLINATIAAFHIYQGYAACLPSSSLTMVSSWRSQAGDWKHKEIPSGLSQSIKADCFQHAKCDKNFPQMYRLLGQHPLRPSTFTAKNYPSSGRDTFYDYVVMIKKEADFMKKWQDIGEEQETPKDNIASNQ